MKTRSRTIILGIAGLVLILAIAAANRTTQEPGHPIARAGNNSGSRAIGLSEPAGAVQPGAGVMLSTPTANGIVVGRDYKHDVSPPLRDIPPQPVGSGTRRDADNENESIPLYGHKDVPDPIVQRVMGPLVMPTPIVSFEGIDIVNGCGGCLPPDTNGEVGPNHYVQMVNSAFQIWDKSGVPLTTARAVNTLWAGFGGPCETRNDGDPVVMYDQLADRWLLSQFTAAAPYNECIAISTTGDPTGAYHRYAFVLSAANFPDYPHFGVWPDGYYMSANQFNNGTTWAGPRPYVFDRTSMLQGLAATFQTTANSLGNTVAPILPADLDGSTPPPAGAPNYFLGYGSPMPFYQFHVDWGTPANTTFTNPTDVANAPFTRLCPGNQSCVPQPGTAVGLDGLADRGMFRLAYRNFGAHESLVGNFSVDVGGGQAGVRWYEIRSPGAGATLFQEGSYAPDATSRWMGSAAMDRDGNLAVGYSASSASVFPSILYAGRLSSDPAGQLTQGEATLFAGLGSQTSSFNRWGDYSDLTVDPTDDCTFWYTTEYNPTTGASVWHTRIGSFKFPGCGGAQATPTPIPGTPTEAPPTATPGGSPTACPIQFTDVPEGSTFYSYIRCLACRGIVSGYTTNPPCDAGTPCFKPFNNVTRGQMAKFISNAANYQDVIPQTQQTFTDVPNSNPFWLYIERAYLHSVISGYTTNPPCTTGTPCFLPYNEVTRGQTAKFVSNAVNYQDPIPQTQQTFTDVPNSNPFWLFIERAYLHSVIGGYTTNPPCTSGTPCFLTFNSVTRGQTAKFISNAFFPNCQTPARR